MPTMAMGIVSDEGGNTFVCDASSSGVVAVLLLWVSMCVGHGRSLDSPMTGRADGAMVSGRK